jgi:hypothetical protein
MPKTLEDRVRLAATRPERIVPDSGIVVEHREGLVATVDESANHRIALPPSHSVALSTRMVQYHQVLRCISAI